MLIPERVRARAVARTLAPTVDLRSCSSRPFDLRRGSLLPHPRPRVPSSTLAPVAARVPASHAAPFFPNSGSLRRKRFRGGRLARWWGQWSGSFRPWRRPGQVGTGVPWPKFAGTRRGKKECRRRGEWKKAVAMGALGLHRSSAATAGELRQSHSVARRGW